MRKPFITTVKFRTFFSSQIKCWISGPEITKCLSEKQRRKTQIRLLLKKQSDLGLCCLLRPFGRQLVFKILEHLPAGKDLVGLGIYTGC